MGYGPFKNYNTYKNALSKWNNGAKKANDAHFQDFKDDLYQAVSDVYADYHLSYGCNYSKEDGEKALEKFFEDPDPFDFANLIDADDDFNSQQYYERDSVKYPSERKIQERNRYSKAIEKMIK